MRGKSQYENMMMVHWPNICFASTSLEWAKEDKNREWTPGVCVPLENNTLHVDGDSDDAKVDDDDGVGTGFL